MGSFFLDANVQDVDGRFSLSNALLIFADNDGDDGEIDCSEIGLWNVALSNSQVNSLGGFGHSLPVSDLQPKGLWKFNNPDNPSEAYYGNDLELVGNVKSIGGTTCN